MEIHYCWRCQKDMPFLNEMNGILLNSPLASLLQLLWKRERPTLTMTDQQLYCSNR